MKEDPSLLRPREWWDAWHGTDRPVDEEIYGAVLAAIGPEPRRIVELGCGSGRFADYAELHGHTYVYGIDISPVAIGKARTSHPDHAFHRGTLLSLGHGVVRMVTPADVVVAIDVLTCLEDDLRVASLVIPTERMVATVRTELSEGHPRCPENLEEAMRRYASFLTMDGPSCRPVARSLLLAGRRPRLDPESFPTSPPPTHREELEGSDT